MLFESSRTQQKSKRNIDSLHDMNPQELKELLDIQAQYESKDRLRELEPMRVDFDVIEFGDNFMASSKKGEREI